MRKAESDDPPPHIHCKKEKKGLINFVLVSKCLRRFLGVWMRKQLEALDLLPACVCVMLPANICFKAPPSPFLKYLRLLKLAIGDAFRDNQL